MPFIRASIVAPDHDPARLEGIRQALSDLAVGALDKDRALTSVLIEAIPAGRWTIGGAAPSVAAHVEISVTAGTNRAEQKAAFVRDVHAMLRRTLGDALPLATYVMVREEPAANWGYGGVTAEARAAHASNQ